MPDALFELADAPAHHAMRRDAQFSADRRYRYVLTRAWFGHVRFDRDFVLWVMLNPSDADENHEDPTVRRCIGFTRALGWSALAVVNEHAFCATRPADLRRAADPVGDGNDGVIRDWSARAGLTIVAWGAHELARARAADVAPLLRDPHCLGVTADGHPRHPLYLRGEARPVRWSLPPTWGCRACCDTGWTQQIVGLPNGQTCTSCTEGEQRRQEARDRLAARAEAPGG
ncbi:MAG: DUF1643 domain-containing protein [Frankiaceae bacterium]|jgi:hypothetical protein